jgi:hypothetical protein
MMGTLAGVLAGKKIRTFDDRYRAEILGDIEDVNGVLKITRIKVHYFLKTSQEKKKDALDSLENYLTRCPAAQSVMGCIALEHEMTVETVVD